MPCPWKTGLGFAFDSYGHPWSPRRGGHGDLGRELFPDADLSRGAGAAAHSVYLSSISPLPYLGAVVA